MSDPSDSSRGPLRVWTQTAGPELTESMPPKNAAMQNMERSFAEKAPKPSFWTYADKALFGLCELLALLFGLPFGDDLYHDKPLSSIGASHWAYLAVAIIFAVSGPMFPWIREHRWLPASATATLSKASLDARVWIYALLLLFTFTIAPEVYQRATAPPVAAPVPVVPAKAPETLKPLNLPGPVTGSQVVAEIKDLRSQVDELKRQNDELRAASKNVLATGAPTRPPVLPSERGPIAWASDNQFLVTSGGGPDSRIHSVMLQGTSNAVVEIKEAYAVSGLTGHRQELMANVQYKGYYPVDKVDIPPDAAVWLELLFKPPLSIREFSEQWAKFHVSILYKDGSIYEREYDETYVSKKLRQIFPDTFGPRVTPSVDK